MDWKGRKSLKNKHGGMRVSLLILGRGTGFENMATFALAVNLVTYFNGVMRFELADAANHLTNFLGTSYILPILAAILADTFIGRCKTVLISLSVEFLTMDEFRNPSKLLSSSTLLNNAQTGPGTPNSPSSLSEALTTAMQHLRSHFPLQKNQRRKCCSPILGQYLLAISSASMKASLPAHGADQFDKKDTREARQMSSFFNCLLLSIALKLSAIIEIIQLYVAAICKRDLQLSEDPTELYELDRDREAAFEAEFLPHTGNFRFLDKAAIQTTSAEQHGGGKAPNQWALCRVTQVENAKIIIGMVPIFCCTIIMTLCLAQLQTFSIQQSLTMDTSITSSFHIPPASPPIIPIAFLIVIVPVYDPVFVPFARKLMGHPAGITHLQLIGVGLVLSSISMAVAAAIDVKQKAVARNHHMLDAMPMLQPLPSSTFWLSFQYFIFGITDMFTYVGLLEFFYSEAPKGIKSVSTCFLWSSMALGYFFSAITVKIVNSIAKGITRSGGWLARNNINRNHLNLFYLLLSMLSLIDFSVYLIVARRYKYRTKSPMRSTPCEKVRNFMVEVSN
ncbi:hypothetical protein NL676_008515 [Syzygium grande]|nr:hypothetical protein NL676_008515 [Syzygium grande]